MGRPRSPARLMVAAVAVVAALAAGAVVVAALSADDSREISQGTAGVAGAVEVGDFVAESLAVGDFDGDGYADVVAGAPHEDIGTNADSGQIQVLYGSALGVSTLGDDVIHQGTKGVQGNSERDDLFGSALAVGDFDGDGNDDLAVGVPGEDIAGATDTGSIVVLYGADNGLSTRRNRGFSQGTPALEGTSQSHDYFGAALATGDFDGDGYGDLAVGAPGDRETGVARAGSVTVLYGSGTGLGTARSLLITQDVDGVEEVAEVGDGFGWSLEAGDFDGDGHDELAVGVPGESVLGRAAAGAVQVFAGSAVGLTIPGNTLVTEATPGVAGQPEADDRFGTALAAGDFDGDAHDDLAIGVPGESKGRKTATGVVQVIRGGPLGLDGSTSKRLTQSSKGVAGKPEPGDELGYSVVVGDFNGFDRDDLAVGVPGEGFGSSNGAGVVHVFFGATTGVRTDNSQTWRPGAGGMAGATESNAGVGRAVAAGDINGDGLDDLVIAAPGRSVGSRAAAGSFLVLLS